MTLICYVHLECIVYCADAPRFDAGLMALPPGPGGNISLNRLPMFIVEDGQEIVGSFHAPIWARETEIPECMKDIS